MKRNLTLIVVIGLLGACSGEVQAPDEHGGTAFQPSTPVVEKPDLDLEAIARLP